MLNALEPTAERTVQIAAVRGALGNAPFHISARAAAISEQRSLHEVIPTLLAAYARFLHDPVKRDPKCLAKQAIARALVTLDCQDVDFYLQGVRYVQLEPVWGGKADAAVDIRYTCAMGLAATGYSRTVAALASLLADTEARVRAGAARAIACRVRDPRRAGDIDTSGRAASERGGVRLADWPHRARVACVCRPRHRGAVSV
ncbi:MAG: hypothetical protein ACREUT_19770 [Steroidobacteraceae bacterium]